MNILPTRRPSSVATLKPNDVSNYIKLGTSNYMSKIPASPKSRVRQAPTEGSINLDLCVTQETKHLIQALRTGPPALESTFKLLMIGSIALETGNYTSYGWHKLGYVGLTTPGPIVTGNRMVNRQLGNVPSHLFQKGNAVIVGRAIGNNFAVGFPTSTKPGATDWDLHAAIAFKLSTMSRLLADKENISAHDIIVLVLAATNIWLGENDSAWLHYDVMNRYAGLDPVVFTEVWWKRLPIKGAESYYWYSRITKSKTAYVVRNTNVNAQKANKYWTQAINKYPMATPRDTTTVIKSNNNF